MYLNEYEIEKITRLATEVATKTYYELAKKENAQLGRKLRHNTIKLLKHYSQLQSYVEMLSRIRHKPKIYGSMNC